jgi:hypothetical protein
MTKNPLSCFQRLIAAELAVRQKDFVKSPNGNNWTRCIEAMLTHQQLEWAIRSRQIDAEALAETLRGRSDWHNVICQATTNMDCADLLRETATAKPYPAIDGYWPAALA